jgi:hypothetical protein
LLGEGRELRHQVLEETVTDLLTLEFKKRQPKRVRVHNFSKRAEGKNGADWEMWLTNPGESSWFGIRFQAKILNYKSSTDRFEHLFYRGRSGVLQSSKLRAAAAKDNAYPLYLLYMQALPPHRAGFAPCCRPLRPKPTLFGCSLLTLQAHNALANNNLNKLDDVKPHLCPFHCLFCCEGLGDHDLPSRAAMWIDSVTRRMDGDVDKPGVQDYPPDYVSALWCDRSPRDAPDEELRMVVAVGSDPSEEPMDERDG